MHKLFEYLDNTPTALEETAIHIRIDSCSYQIQKSSLDTIASAVEVSLHFGQYKASDTKQHSLTCHSVVNMEVAMTVSVALILNRFLFPTEELARKGFCVHQGPLRGTHVADLYVAKRNDGTVPGDVVFLGDGKRNDQEFYRGKN